MALSNQEKKLLNDIFSAFLKSPNGLKAARFRADNEKFISELDQLERLGCIQRSNDIYFINPLALAYLAKENPNAQSLVEKCGLVFALLQGDYRDNLGEKIPIPDIARRTGLSEDDVSAALNIIIKTPILESYTSNLAGENAFIAPSENILKYKSFEDILKEREEWDKSSIEVSRPTTSNIVFIIYGHDELNRLRLEKLLRERWALDPVVLLEEAGKGRTLIEKFEEEAQRANFAIALLTPDDMIQIDKDQYAQARPNVVFELGWFYGRLGRNKVCILLKEGTKIHSDLDGISRIEFKNSINDKIVEIEKELREAGLLKKA